MGNRQDARGRGGLGQTGLTIAIMLWAYGAGALDTLTVKGKDPVRGSLTGFTSDKFDFDAGAGKPQRTSRIMVESLVMRPPAKVILKLRGKKETDGYVLEGYQKPNFTFSQDKKPLVVSGSQVTRIQMGLDFERARLHAQAAEAGPAEAAPVDLADIITPGTPTIVHFHMPGLMASERQGSYVRAVVRESRGRVKLVRVVIDDWESPKLAHYGIASLPQFWIYNRQAQRIEQLQDRFTTADIDAALKQARR